MVFVFPSSTDGHTHYFQFLSVRHKSAINILISNFQFVNVVPQAGTAPS